MELRLGESSSTRTWRSTIPERREDPGGRRVSPTVMCVTAQARERNILWMAAWWRMDDATQWMILLCMQLRGRGCFPPTGAGAGRRLMGSRIRGLGLGLGPRRQRELL